MSGTILIEKNAGSQFGAAIRGGDLVCKGDVGRLNLSDARGELPAAVDLESRTARFALLASLGPNAPDTPLVQSQRAALFSRRPPQAPIALVRNGKEFKITGNQSTVRAVLPRGTWAGFNEGAAPVNTQVLGNDIQVIFPQTFATAKPVFPMPPA